MSTTNTVPTGSKSKAMDATGPVQKLLSFGLGNEEYGLDILAVREIIGLIDVTPLPRTPDYVKGVINLRGKIIPVIELRARFGMPSVKYTDETCIIVVDVPTEGEAESRLMGVVVDTVREVLDIPALPVQNRFGGLADHSRGGPMGVRSARVVNGRKAETAFWGPPAGCKYSRPAMWRCGVTSARSCLDDMGDGHFLPPPRRLRPSQGVSCR